MYLHVLSLTFLTSANLLICLFKFISDYIAIVLINLLPCL